MRQKKKLVKQFENRQDSDDWQAKLDEIIKAADDKQWTHAATLDRMTAELDKSGKEAEKQRNFGFCS